MKRMRNNNITKIPLMAAVIAVCSLIAIPLPTGVPVTLQTFAVVLAGCMLGWKGGGCAVIIYLAVGAVGVPVFSGFTGGAACLFGVTGGYLWGFVPLAAMSGLFRNGRKWHRWAAAAAGLAVCHLMGSLWLSVVTEMPAGAAFLAGSAPYIIKDVLSAALAFYTAGKVRSVV